MLRDFLHLIFPNLCHGCQRPLVKGEDLVCTVCLYELPKTNNYENQPNEVWNKYAGRIPLEFCASYLKFGKSSSVQKLLHKLKYENKPQIGVMLGKMYAEDLKGCLSADVIVPLPLHKRRQRVRGYNQSEVFAKGLAEGLDIMLNTTAVVRTKHTKTQTKKSREERYLNMKEVFAVKDAEAFRGKKVLLVDDVVTTGATLTSCAEEILRAGAKAVDIVTIAAAE